MKEFITFVGVDEAKTIDEAKAKFSGQYYTEKQIHDDPKLLGKFTGKTIKRIKQNIISKARERDIPFTQSDFDNVELIEDVFDQLATKQAETFGGKITELQGQIGKTGEEAIKPYKDKIDQYERSLTDERKAKKDIADEYEKFKGDMDGKVKTIENKYYKNDLLGKVNKQLDQVKLKDPLVKVGWESTIDSNVKFDKDEHGEFQAFDLNGQKFKDPKKADRWLSPEEVVMKFADPAGLIPKNPQGGQPAFRPPVPPPFGTQPPAAAQPPAGAVPNKNRLAPGMEQYLSK